MAKLYILGNGFDLAHGLETKYSDFRKWLSRKCNRLLFYILIYNEMGVFSQKLDGNWANIENCLKLNLSRIDEINNAFSKVDFSSYTFATKFFKSSIYGTILKVFKNKFRSWVKEIEKQINKKELKIKEIFDFSADDKFISFNYTSTLQIVYKIADANIRQIHGRISLPNYITFGTKKNNKSNITEPNEYTYTFNKEYKGKKETIINKVLPKWCENIEEVVIYGCTFDMESGDFEYFNAFSEYLKGKKIKLIYYCDESNPNDLQDKNEKEKLIEALNKKNELDIELVSSIDFLKKHEHLNLKN